MTALCVGCGLRWNVSVYQRIPDTGYICPHCTSRMQAGEDLREIKARRSLKRKEYTHE